jgi:hypothetical protein
MTSDKVRIAGAHHEWLSEDLVKVSSIFPAYHKAGGPISIGLNEPLEHYAVLARRTLRTKYSDGVLNVKFPAASTFVDLKPASPKSRSGRSVQIEGSWVVYRSGAYKDWSVMVLVHSFSSDRAGLRDLRVSAAVKLEKSSFFHRVKVTKS